MSGEWRSYLFAMAIMVCATLFSYGAVHFSATAVAGGGADETQFSEEDADELWQLVEAVSHEEFSDAGGFWGGCVGGVFSFICHLLLLWVVMGLVKF